MSRPLRVLYTLWHYPHLSESYVRTEIRAVLAHGVDVQVWAQARSKAPYESEVPHHYGDIEKVLAEFRPDLIHQHWLNSPRYIVKEARGAGLPITVRGHGFESSRKKAMRAARDPLVSAAFPFPQFVPRLPWKRRKIHGIPVGFDPTLYAPGSDKDRRLVVRCGVGLPTKDYRSYFEIARRCPEHHFVLAVCPAHTHEDYMDEVESQNRELGSPVELRTSLQHEEVAALVKKAGIYLHTTLREEPFGMPISIAEAMASGCYVIARRMPYARRYVGNAGDTYTSIDAAAALVKDTLTWSDASWQGAKRRSVERAFKNFVNTDVYAPMVARWRAIAAR